MKNYILNFKQHLCKTIALTNSQRPIYSLPIIKLLILIKNAQMIILLCTLIYAYQIDTDLIYSNIYFNNHPVNNQQEYLFKFINALTVVYNPINILVSFETCVYFIYSYIGVEFVLFCLTLILECYLIHRIFSILAYIHATLLHFPFNYILIKLLILSIIPPLQESSSTSFPYANLPDIVSYSNFNNTGSEHILLIILNIIILILNIILSTLLTTYYFQDYQSPNYLTSYNNFEEIYYHKLLFVISIIVNISLFSNITLTIIINSIIIISSLYIMYYLLYYNIYENIIILKYVLSRYIFLLVISLISIYTNLTCTYKSHNIYYVYIFLILIVIMLINCSNQLIYMIQQNLFTKYPYELKNELLVLAQFNIFKNIIYLKEGDYHSIMTKSLATSIHDNTKLLLFNGILIRHYSECIKSGRKCPCNYNLIESKIYEHTQLSNVVQYYSDDVKCIRDFCRMLLESYLYYHPKSINIKLLMITYYIYDLHLWNKSYSMIENLLLKSSELSLIQYIKLYQLNLNFKMVTNLEQEKTNHSNEKRIDIFEMIVFQNSFKIFRQLFHQQIYNHQNLWDILMRKNDPTRLVSELYKPIYNQGLIILELNKKITKTWDEMKTLIRDRIESPYLLYGLYMIIINNSNKKGEEMLKIYRNILHKKNIFEKLDMIEENNLFSNLNMYFIISAEPNKLGIIMECSDNISTYLSLDKPQIINENIKIIIPNIYTKHHQTYLVDFTETGKGNIFEKTRKVFYKDKHGNINPCLILVKHIHTDEYGMIFVSLIRVSIGNGEYILIDEDGFIDSVTKGINEELFIDTIRSNRYPNLNINQYCNKFTLINKCFNTITKSNIQQNILFDTNKQNSLNISKQDIDVYKKFTHGTILKFIVPNFPSNSTNNSSPISPSLNQRRAAPNKLGFKPYMTKIIYFNCIINDHYIRNQHLVRLIKLSKILNPASDEDVFGTTVFKMQRSMPTKDINNNNNNIEPLDIPEEGPISTICKDKEKNQEEIYILQNNDFTDNILTEPACLDQFKVKKRTEGHTTIRFDSYPSETAKLLMKNKRSFNENHGTYVTQPKINDYYGGSPLSLGDNESFFPSNRKLTQYPYNALLKKINDTSDVDEEGEMDLNTKFIEENTQMKVSNKNFTLLSRIMEEEDKDKNTTSMHFENTSQNHSKSNYQKQISSGEHLMYDRRTIQLNNVSAFMNGDDNYFKQMSTIIPHEHNNNNGNNNNYLNKSSKFDTVINNTKQYNNNVNYNPTTRQYHINYITDTNKKCTKDNLKIDELNIINEAEDKEEKFISTNYLQSSIAYNNKNPTNSQNSSITRYSKKKLDRLFESDHQPKILFNIKIIILCLIAFNITMTIVIDYSQTLLVERIQNAIFALNSNLDRTNIISEINLRTRIAYLISENYIDTNRHFNIGIPNYEQYSLKKVYESALQLHNLNILLTEFIYNQIDVKYANEIMSLKVRIYWDFCDDSDVNTTALVQNDNEFNLMDSVSILLSKVSEIAYLPDSSFNISKKDMKFILNNTLGNLKSISIKTTTILSNSINKLFDSIYITSMTITIVYCIILFLQLLLFIYNIYRLKKWNIYTINIYQHIKLSDIRKIIKRISIYKQFFQKFHNSNNFKPTNYTNHIIEFFNKVKRIEASFGNSISLDYSNSNTSNNRSHTLSTYHTTSGSVKATSIIINPTLMPNNKNIDHFYQEFKSSLIKISFITLTCVVYITIITMYFINYYKQAKAINYVNMNTHYMLESHEQSFALTYMFIEYNGTGYIFEKNLSSVLDEISETQHNQINFFNSYFDQITQDPRIYTYLHQDLCPTLSNPNYTKECYEHGSNTGRLGLVSLNTYVYKMLINIQQAFVNSNRSDIAIKELFASNELEDLEIVFFRVLMPTFKNLISIINDLSNKQAQSFLSIINICTIIFNISFILTGLIIVSPIITKLKKHNNQVINILHLIPTNVYRNNRVLLSHLSKIFPKLLKI